MHIRESVSKLQTQCVLILWTFYITGTNIEDPRKVYNYRHSRARRVIENSFGILAARWRILGKPMEFLPDKAEMVVKACIALHNMLAYTDAALTPQRSYIPPGFADAVTPAGDLVPGEWRRLCQGDTNLTETARLSTARASRRAVAVRNDFKAFFQTPQGVVPWQDAAIRQGCLN